MATITNTSPENGATGEGTIVVGNLRITVEFDIGDSGEPWGAGDCQTFEYYLDGDYTGNSLGWKPSGSYGKSYYGLEYNTTYTWRVDIIVDDTGNEPTWYRVTGDTWSFTTLGVPTKATNPTPTNNDTGVDFSGLELSWDDGGNTETYNVYIGKTDDLTLVSSAQEGTNYTTTMEELQTIFDATPIGQKIYWRIDSTNGAGTTTGDEWNFDPRPAKPTTPTPTNANASVTLDQAAIAWEDGGGATSYNVYYGDTSGALTLVSEGQAGLFLTVTNITLGSPYGYLITRYWRIDSVNAVGTTTGDEWSFTTINFDQLRVSYDLISDGSGSGPYDDPPGIEGTDFRYNGENNMFTVKRLVAAANNTIWFENI